MFGVVVYSLEKFDNTFDNSYTFIIGGYFYGCFIQILGQLCLQG